MSKCYVEEYIFSGNKITQTESTEVKKSEGKIIGYFSGI